MADQAQLDILIQIREELSGLRRSQEEFRKLREETRGFGEMLKTGFGIDFARRSLDLLKATLRSTVFEAVNMADQLDATSQNLGIAAEALQVLTGAGKDANAEFGTVVQSLTHLKKNVIEARDGTGQLATEFGSLGLNASVMASLPLEQQFEAVARAVARAEDQGAAFNSALQILGTRNAPQLIAVLQRLGKDGFSKMAEDIRQSYGIMSEDTVKKLADAKERIEQLRNKATVQVGELLGTLDIDENVEVLIKGAGSLAQAGKDIAEAFGRIPAAIIYGRQAVRDSDAAEAAREEARRRARADTPPELPVDTTQQELNRLQALRVFNQGSIDTARNDGTGREVERRRELARALRQEVGYLEEIVVLTAKQRVLSDGAAKGNFTEADLQKLREQYKLLAQISALKAEVNELDKPPVQRSRERAEAVNDPNANPEYQTMGQGLQTGAYDFVSNLGSVGEQVSLTLQSTLGATVSGITDGIYGWITGTESFGAAMLNLGGTVFRTFLNSIIQMGVQWLITQALIKMGLISIEATGDTLRAQRVVKENAAEAATLPAKTAGAAAAGISSWGVALAFGVAAIALIAALSGGFAEGGPVRGPGTGTSDSILARLSNGEYVMPADAVRRIGLPALDDMRFGRSEIGTADTLSSGAFTPPAAAGGGASTLHQNLHVLFNESEFAERMLNSDAAEDFFVRMQDKYAYRKS